MSLLGFNDPLTAIASVITGLAIVLSLIKYYLYLTCGQFNSARRMDGKTVIITGANSGIGKETARDLARRGARIIMACRNMETAKQARDELMVETGNKQLIVKHIDVSSLASVRAFAKEIVAAEPVIDVLIHNAGVAQGFNNKVTEDGLEFTMATNYYGIFLLTHLLIEPLKKAEQGRIVVVSSKLYQYASLNPSNINSINPVNYFSLFPIYLYNLSKFAEIMFTQELARRLSGTKVTANCLHPGVIDTGIWRNVPFPINILFKPVQMCFRTPEEGARTSIYLSVSPDVESISGQYFRGCRVYGLNRRVQNVTKQRELWEASKKLVKLTDEDPQI
ncbi:retinol dehydrogenase 14 isoform X1 [Anopheles aquasalis]|uniref:retinol dehydrogenase 14 isoform X1 n=2 Tax=Anopheles aquasalis TaxID=42839 RepID=UPI00215AE28F|nr:retinol dehydrogenase 14 isoform X1 [Anopheles aquasalis]XP_050094970.1 retinol dehydrogenase 14 isoform X1 [Anopheles aquasalis]